MQIPYEGTVKHFCDKIRVDFTEKPLKKNSKKFKIGEIQKQLPYHKAKIIDKKLDENSNPFINQTQLICFEPKIKSSNTVNDKHVVCLLKTKDDQKSNTLIDER